jgi:hypothetical protein
VGRRKTTAQHAAEAKALGRVELVGEYLGARTKTKYRCLTHEHVDDALPTNILKGRGLKCCKNPGIDLEYGKKTSAIHAAEVKTHGRVELIGEYIDAKTKCLYRCLRHGKIHLALPSNIRKGCGLKCCQEGANIRTQSSRKELAASLYDDRLSRHNKLERIESYKGAHVPILHRCLVHGLIGLQTPNGGKSGRGLRCCVEAAREVNARTKRQSVIDRLNNELSDINPNLTWIGGEYKNQNTRLVMQCKKHGETHLASWQQIAQGCGIRCCRIENLRRIGKRSLNRFDVDSVWRVLSRKNQRDGSAWIYLYESPEKGLNKFGISNDLNKRAKYGGYGEKLIEPRFYPERDDAVLIEQAFKFGYGCEPPERLNNWTGNTELTTLTAEEFTEVIEELERELLERGRWRFAEEFCDPRELERAQKEKNRRALPE